MTIERALTGLTKAGASAATYVEDVFSTYLYTGNGSTQTITNGIDLSTKGGLVWVQTRNISGGGLLVDTVRGVYKWMQPCATSGQITTTDTLTAFNTNGFSLGADGNTYGFNLNTASTVSWTFRKQPKFFDIVTYTGTGSARTIAHNLGATPGMIIVKRTDTTGNWQVYHKSLTSAAYAIQLNLTNAQASATTVWNSTAPTSSVFSVGTDATVNASGGTYVAYIYADQAGGFGAAGTDSVVACGNFTNGSSYPGPFVNLGWEPQFLLVKRTDSSSGGADWYIVDNMRGLNANLGDKTLSANTSAAEVAGNIFNISATGFTPASGPYAPASFIYLAIRRPMKTPTDATKVFAPTIVSSSTTGTSATTGFPIDLQIYNSRDATSVLENAFFDRLRGISSNSTESGPSLYPAYSGGTAAESNYNATLQWSNTGFKLPSVLTNTTNQIFWNFKRAPGFFDVVCYTGNGSTQTVNHNLGVVPELVITKNRASATNWPVLFNFTSTNMSATFLNTTAYGAASNDTYANVGVMTSQPTTTQMFLSNSTSMNQSGSGIVSYLFATCPGVSKVGSYTGTGSAQNIACGFTAGARFVLIKRTDSTGDWYVWDSARGINASGTNDPYLLLDSTAADVTSTDYLGTYSSGFALTSSAPAALNASGGTYLFLAIA